MKSYIINFIRHGMTEANIKGQYVGVTDISVCEEGFNKLKSLKNNCSYPKVETYYSSPLKRCIQTCKVIYPDAEPTVIEGLKECDFGDWEEKTPDDLKDNQEYHAWIKSGRELTPPNGESGEHFKERLCSAVENLINDLLKKGITSSAVFAHGGVIMAILAIYGLPKLDPYELIVANGCGYSVRVTPGLWMRDKVFEICEKIPLGHGEEISGKFKNMIEEQIDGEKI